MQTYPRESVEFQPVTVAVDGTEVATGVEFSLTTAGERPVIWEQPTVVGGQLGIMVAGLTPGIWQVWARVTSTQETPVVDCGHILIT